MLAIYTALGAIETARREMSNIIRFSAQANERRCQSESYLGSRGNSEDVRV